ncbi:hypothetical protein N7E81_08350 [Reichenbachiella carrageenanivorans]|uniref:Glycosyl transferase family 8 n=1 Tax=Reichenbachiella carrageenanivorans TaxID=2979869 RepID=A0ABY6DBA0_9BACT|nr:hypothetical protein [Reichenbachiella carrageenanivorans]UXX81110.1 hypothetical protein N7E81_08350 [Reichenbachiella carrageenanivorans]
MSSLGHKHDTTVIICCEKGDLENQSILFVRSLRKFGGDFKKSRVLCFCPRPHRTPTNHTLKLLEKEEVEIITKNLNPQYSDYGFGNKPLICGYAERNFPSRNYVFFDSDQLILKEPTILKSLSPTDTFLLPVDKKGVGSTGSDETATFWKNLHNHFNIKQPRKLKTTVTNTSIWNYWNAGLLPVVGNKEIYSQWQETFEEMMGNKMFPSGNKTFTDQISFSLAVQQLEINIDQLPIGYNYPIQDHFNTCEENKILNVASAHTLHYHRSFKTPSKANKAIFQLLSEHPQYNWFMDQFQKVHLYPRPFTYRLKYYFNSYLNTVKNRL